MRIDVYNVKIPIEQLVSACRALGEVKVVAAGAIYATLDTDYLDRRILTKAKINWSRD